MLALQAQGCSKSAQLFCGTSFVCLAMAGCTTLPTGPEVLVFPGTGQTFESFQIDDANCRQYAFVQIGGVTSNQAAADSGLRSAAAGALIGAAAGAALGGHRGAGSGAGAGLAMGSLVGVGAASESGNNAQRQYDQAYTQCMYAKGHLVPVFGEMRSRQMPSSIGRPLEGRP
jgi:hypothetical protein